MAGDRREGVGPAGSGTRRRHWPPEAAEPRGKKPAARDDLEQKREFLSRATDPIPSPILSPACPHPGGQPARGQTSVIPLPSRCRTRGTKSAPSASR